jgi:hypothetical protein
VGTGIALALAASLALNVGYLLQHSGLVEVPAITLRRPAATLRALLASRAWLGGLAIATRRLEGGLLSELRGYLGAPA